MLQLGGEQEGVLEPAPENSSAEKNRLVSHLSFWLDGTAGGGCPHVILARAKLVRPERTESSARYALTVDRGEDGLAEEER
jgi:hypothetical protein